MSKDSKGGPPIGTLHEESEEESYNDSFLTYLHDEYENVSDCPFNNEGSQVGAAAAALGTPTDYSSSEDPFPSVDEKDEEDHVDEGDENNEEVVRAGALASMRSLETYGSQDPFPSADEHEDTDDGVDDNGAESMSEGGQGLGVRAGAVASLRSLLDYGSDDPFPSADEYSNEDDDEVKNE